MIVYLDVYFLICFVMNLSLLDTQRKMLGIQKNYKRTVLAALFAGVTYTILLFVCDLVEIYYVWIINIADCIVINYIHYGKTKLKEVARRLIVTLLTFYLSANVLRKINSTVQYNTLAKTLLTIVVCKLIVDLAYTFIRNNITEQNTNYKKAVNELTEDVHRIMITYRQRTIEATAIFDTGNSLVDPFFRRPVAVISKCLYEKVHQIKKEQDNMIIIPYSSVGTEGILYGFKVDSITIMDKRNANGEMIIIKNPILAVHKNELSFRKKYDVLLNPKMLEGAN